MPIKGCLQVQLYDSLQLFNEINHATLDVIASVNSSKTMIDKLFYLVEFIDRFRNEC